MSWVPDLPEEPVDGYELCFWEVNCYGVVVEHRLVYHENRPFEEVERHVCPIPGCGAGAPFREQWAHYQNGTLICRHDWWPPRPAGLPERDRVFPTRQEAAIAAIAHWRRSIVELQQEIERAQENIRDLEASDDAR